MCLEVNGIPTYEYAVAGVLIARLCKEELFCCTFFLETDSMRTKILIMCLKNSLGNSKIIDTVIRPALHSLKPLSLCNHHNIINFIINSDA